ncbi:MAG: hypothetical protein AAGC67_18545 [Myxococcota bacterium]
MAADAVVARDHARLVHLVEARLGRRVVRAEAMAAGLGTRRFHRLFLDDEATLVARLEDDGTVAPRATAWPDAPAWHAEPPLEPLRGFLEEAGLPVPRSALHLADEGLDLLEDVGRTNLLTVAPDVRRARTLEACALLPALQALDAPPERVPAFGRHYDASLIATKAWKWLHWTIPMLLGRAATPDEAHGIETLFDAIQALAADAPRRLAHRDFKAENLHLVPGDTPEARLVMIDVQGAFLAPPEYDLACLLYDLQVGHDEAFVREALDRTRSSLPDAPDEATFRARFDALALARLCKDVSHVVHAGLARGDRRRWPEIPRGLALIERISGRRTHTLPGLRALTSVTAALTAALQAADSGRRGRAGESER